jgi:O-antigen ligase
VFWSVQRALRHGGQRWLARAIATLGLVLAPLCVIHHLNLIPGLDALYPPIRRDLRPWGPFVNRNDFAGWMALATALTLGYLVARLEAHHHEDEGFDPERAFDATGTRLAVAMCLMCGGIMLSLSRSGLLGVGVGMVAFVAMGRGRLAPGRRKGLAAIVVALLAIGALFANAGALSSRLQIAMSEGMTGRLSEWRQTWPMVVDFWPVGTGVGAYARVMELYQTSTRLITIAHADSEPLQIAAEGGLLVGLPVAALLVAFVATAIRRLRADRTHMYWIRAGAISGLAAIAAQNLVEMTLRVPATGLLAVVLAAIAVHERT